MPEDVKSEGRGFESQGRLHFSPMKVYLHHLALETVHGACVIYVKCINLSRVISGSCILVEKKNIFKKGHQQDL